MRPQAVLNHPVWSDAKILVPVQTETGYRLEAVTTRKLEFENDAFAFGDKVVEKWYGTVEQGNNKGILVVVTTGKDGALTGGPGFMKVRTYRIVSEAWHCSMAP